ncbi:PHD finger protein 7-like [Anopheles marshallii]|uniref:PHD finger protein 7-like n=1 Tax=Anopheles marshallii TaxID=1521116 RepID=UPI00237A1038|nr:PHD finger protein 7-like [Anopheles marshallii]
MNQSTFFNVSYCTDPLFKLNVLKKTTSVKCDVCLLGDNNPVRYGEFIEKTYSKQVLRVHYFCLLSGTYIEQNASSDGAGIAGFKLRDIFKSYEEYRTKSCFYCRHLSAPIECAQRKCGRRFHYICGYNNSCLTQFFGQYLSYCHQHIPAELCKPLNTKERDCNICYMNLPDVMDPNFNPLAIIRTHCSSECPAGLLHRECVQKFAYSSGYNFKCPLCWNKKFKTHAAKSGIFIPERESAWEREPDAFKDLHKRKCTAVPCVAENAQQEDELSELVGCKICGGQLKHKLCAGVTDENDYLCNVCRDDSFANLV